MNDLEKARLPLAASVHKQSPMYAQKAIILRMKSKQIMTLIIKKSDFVNIFIHVFYIVSVH